MPLPLKHPRQRCPITGKPVELRCLGDNKDWMIVADGWSSRLFQTAEQALFWFSHNAGVPPVYARQTIQVVGDRRPDDENPLHGQKPDMDKIREVVDGVVMDGQA